MAIADIVLGVNKKELMGVIQGIKAKNWKEVSQDESYKKLGLNSKMLVQKYYQNNVIAKSSKFRKLDITQKKSVIDKFEQNRVTEIFQEGFKKPIANVPFLKAMDIGGQAVEKVAQTIEPKGVPAGRTTAGMLVKDLPRQLTADVLRFYKPWNVMAAQATGQVIRKVAPAVGKGISKVTPKVIKEPLQRFIKEPLQRFFTVGKGQPIAYQLMKERTLLEKAAGGREAEAVAKTLSIAPKDIVFKTKEGITKTIKKGQPVPLEYQRYMGRIFRKEIDVSGLKSRIAEPIEKTRHIAKNVEVEVAFNPKIQNLNKELSLVNKSLRNKKLIAESKVGQVFETKPGNIEKITGVEQVTKVTKAGKVKPTGKYDLVSEPVVPTESIPSRIIPKTIAGEEEVLRRVKGIGKEKILTKAEAIARKNLLSRRKVLSKALQKETIKVETDVRAQYDIFDKTFVDKITNHPRYKELKDISDKGRKVMDDWSKQLVASGVPKEQARETIEANVGKYMARMYKSKIAPTGHIFSPRNLRLRLNGLKHRKDLTESVRKRLGEIKEPALPTAIRVKEISETVANQKLFNQVAKNPEWTANTNLTGKMIQLPNTPAMGPLKNKWVIRSIADDVNGIMKVKDASNDILAKTLSLYEKGLSKWKYSKVVLNPATHVRNMMSNSMLLDLSGVNHFRQLQLMPRVMKDYMAKGQMYQLALKNGAIGGEFVGAEVAKIKDLYLGGQGGNLSRWMNVLKAKGFSPSQIYQAEEQLAKMVKFSDMISKGHTPEIAAREAQKWLFNYNQIPDAIKVAKHLAPFVTFTYKSIPRIAEAMANNPLKVYKYYALFNGWNEASRKLQGMTPEEYAREKDALPPWSLKSVGGVPSNLLMPWRDKYNRTQWLNLEYILPIGMAPEILQKGILKGGISNPLLNLYADLSKNQDFKGEEIIPIGATRSEAMGATLNYIYRQIAPSLAPGLEGKKGWEGGYSFSKIANSLEKIPDYADRVRNVPTTLLDALAGIKLTPIDVEESQMFKQFEKKKLLQEYKKQILRLNHPAIPEPVRNRLIENIYIKMQKVFKQ